MGLRAFVARSGWNKTPISGQEWHEAASTLPELDLHGGHGEEPVRAMLRGSRHRGLSLQHGYLCGDHVDRRLIAVMFVLADRLGAQVYSEHRRVYRDMVDWEERTRHRSSRRSSHRQSASVADDTRSAPTIDKPSWLPFLLGGVVACLLAVWALV